MRSICEVWPSRLEWGLESVAQGSMGRERMLFYRTPHDDGLNAHQGEPWNPISVNCPLKSDGGDTHSEEHTQNCGSDVAQVWTGRYISEK